MHCVSLGIVLAVEADRTMLCITRKHQLSSVFLQSVAFVKGEGLTQWRANRLPFPKEFHGSGRGMSSVLFFMLTQVIQVPQGKYKVLPTERTKVSSYPVALIPGQFQEYYKRYSLP